MRNKIALYFLFCIIPGFLFAQTNEEKKKQVVEIKKNTADYIYSSKSCDMNAGETEKMCYENAHEELLQKVSVYLDENSATKGYSSVILKDIQKSVKNLTFENSSMEDMKVVVVTLYIKKSDIAPQQSASKASVNIEQEKTQENSTPDSFEDEQIALEETIIAHEALYEDEILSEIIKTKDYNSHRTFLENRKLTKADVKTGLTKDFNASSDCIWIVYDQNRKMIALIDKSKTIDLLSGKKISISDYAKYAKLWIYVYD